MTATLTRDHITPDELVGVALHRADRLALRIASSRALGRAEVERHADLDDLAAIHAALKTWRVLYAEEVG